MCLLFESIRLENGTAHYLEYHQRRVNRSIGSGRLNMESYVKAMELPRSGCFKLRITYSDRGEVVAHTITPYAARKIETLRLVDGDGIEYDRKWNDRSEIDRLYQLRGSCDDILIIRQGLVTDTSFANIALYDGSRWVTPSHPLLMGTCRERLLEEGVIVAQRITVESLSAYSQLMPINAMIGFNTDRAIFIATPISCPSKG